MILRQTLPHPVNGQQVIDWRVSGRTIIDSKGSYTEVCTYFPHDLVYVKRGKTEKQTLGNARRRLRTFPEYRDSKFEYVENEK